MVNVNVMISPGIFLKGGFQIGRLLPDKMVVARGLREASVAFVKATITQKYVAWLSVCNSKSMLNFESVRGADEYSDVQA